MRRATFTILIAACGLAGCAYDEPSPPQRTRIGFISEPEPAYRGRGWAAPREVHEGELSGPGVAILDDWLKGTREGRIIVTLGFADASRGVVSEDVAHRANIWFRNYADFNRDMTITDAEIRNALAHAAGPWVRRDSDN